MTKDVAADKKQQTKRPRLPNRVSEKRRPTDLALGVAAVQRLQQQVGNRAVQRLLAQRKGGRIQRWGKGTPTVALGTGPQITDVGLHRGPLPSIAHLPAKTQTLLQGVLEEASIDAAVRRMYDNIWNLSGWKYNASIPGVDGTGYINGTKDAGMCEAYRNAFRELLLVYNGLRVNHPNPAIRNGQLDIVAGNDLSTTRFMTRRGLTLMGPAALKGNVYLEVDGNGTILDQGLDTINRFVFMGHWTLIVNNVEYDPIFHSINEDNVAEKVDHKYESAVIKLLPDTSKAIPTGEFGATFILISDLATYKANKDRIQSFYNANSQKIDALLGTSKLAQMKVGIFRPGKSGLSQQCRDVLAPIADLDTFTQLVQMEAPRAILQALRKVRQLAGR